MTRFQDPVLKVRNAALAFLALILVGITGYMTLEGYNVLDAFYMTVITLATVGFAEVKPLDPTGKLFTSFLILSGLGIVAYAATTATQVLIEDRIFMKRRLAKRAHRMKNHVIICGYGRIGRRIALKLSEREIPFVIVEKDSSVIEIIQEQRYILIEGNAVEDEVLRRANIEDARCLVAALNSDSENVYITLTARSMNGSLYIVARSSDASNEEKLRRAGADKVISPYEIGAMHMANAVLRPHVVDFMEVVAEGVTDRTKDLEIDEILIPPGSPYAGRMLRECPIRSEMNIIVLAIKDSTGVVEYNPSPDRTLDANDMLICIGYIDKLDQLARSIQMVGSKVR